MQSQSIKFLIIGILNTVVGYLIYFVCLKFFDLNYIFSLLYAHVLGVLHSYFWNSKWTFKKGRKTYKNLLKFSGVYGVSFLINLLVLYILINYLSLTPLLSQGFALFITTLISFIGHKYWSFKISKTHIRSGEHVENK
ncbi:GtrA family protein [Paenibacillus andongensis]|uniref:GtrA family protein n=1 Tax=Paenibacillus andongensis TaxID=2975482 RepID=UPI003461E35D